MQQFKGQKFDEKIVKNVLRFWSRESSSLWTAENPARGQCGVTALVIQDYFGGKILKTLMDEESHFYKRSKSLAVSIVSPKNAAAIAPRK